MSLALDQSCRLILVHLVVPAVLELWIEAASLFFLAPKPEPFRTTSTLKLVVRVGTRIMQDSVGTVLKTCFLSTSEIFDYVSQVAGIPSLRS